MQPAIAATGLRKSFGDHVVLDGVDLTVAPGTVFALLGPNGAGKTTIVQILSTLISADAGDIRVAGHDVRAEPDAVRAAIGVTGQFSAVDGLLNAEENLLLMADLHHLDRAEGRRRAQRADRAVRPGGRGPQALRTVLRRHATPARPGDGPGRRSPHRVPGRADHRPRPAQPPADVADRPGAGRRGRHHPADHPVPGRGRPARRPDRRAGPRHAGRRGHRGRAEAAGPRRPHPAAAGRRRSPAPGRATSSARAPPTPPS